MNICQEIFQKKCYGETINNPNKLYEIDGNRRVNLCVQIMTGKEEMVQSRNGENYHNSFQKYFNGEPTQPPGK